MASSAGDYALALVIMLMDKHIEGQGRCHVSDLLLLPLLLLLYARPFFVAIAFRAGIDRFFDCVALKPLRGPTKNIPYNGRREKGERKIVWEGGGSFPDVARVSPPVSLRPMKISTMRQTRDSRVAPFRCTIDEGSQRGRGEGALLSCWYVATRIRTMKRTQTNCMEDAGNVQKAGQIQVPEDGRAQPALMRRAASSQRTVNRLQ